MIANLHTMLGADLVGITALSLLTSSFEPTTYENGDTGMRHFTAFCHEEGIHPLQSSTHSIVRYTAWVGLQGIVVIASL
jgi:hypothetical protein